MSSVQQTLRGKVLLQGIGLHTGESVAVSLHPAPVDHGVRFICGGDPDARSVEAHVQHVVDTRLATSIGDQVWRVSTIEHLLSALQGLELDNVQIEVHGDELPILDGSAQPWVEAIDRVGIETQDAPRKILEMIEAVEIRQGERWVRLRPGSGFEIRATIEFDHPSVSQQELNIELSPEVYRRELAWARTFGFWSDIEGLRRMGLIRGGSLDNAVVFGPDGVMNPEGLRAPDEPIRHKVLDMVGDLALIGYPIRGIFEASRPGHALTRALVAEILQRESCWRLLASE